MKAVGCLLGVLVVAAGAFFAFTAFVVTRGEDQSGLTRRVELSVIDPREDARGSRGDGWSFDYAYEVDGRWYGDQDWLRDDSWSPGQALTACVDPGSPTRHVVVLDGQRCGQERIAGNVIAEAEPRSAPEARPRTAGLTAYGTAS